MAATKSPKPKSGVTSIPASASAKPALYPQELLAIEKIIDDGKNPRLASKRDVERFDNLVGSVWMDGVKQPILVYPEGGKYHLVFGNRRLAAAREVGWKQMPAMVMDHVPAESEKQRLRATENLNRQDLNAAEEALLVVQMVEAAGDVAGAAAELGRSETWVRDRLYLERLCVKVRDLLAAGRINLGQARELAMVGDVGDQVDIGEEIALAAPGNTDAWRGVKVYSVEEVRGMVANKKRSLRVVQWKLEVAFAGKPACVGCKDNTATDRTLFGTSDEEAEKGCCLNQGCFETKAKSVLKVQEKAVEKVREQVKKKEISAEDAGGAAVAREQSPEWIKPESVQRVVKKELGLSTPAAVKKAMVEWGHAYQKWTGALDKAIEAKAKKDPWTYVAWVILGNTQAISDLDYRYPTDSYEVGQNGTYKNDVKPPAAKPIGPVLSHLIDLVAVRSFEALMELAAEKCHSYTYLEGFPTASAPADVIERLAKAFGVKIEAAPMFEDFLPKDLRPAKKAEAAPPPVKLVSVDLMDQALDQALHATAGSLGRWTDRGDRGMDDADLAAAIGEEWKGNPGFSGGDYGYETKGGKKIGFLFNEKGKTTAQNPMLEGKALVAKVRELLKIPQPQAAAKGKKGAFPATLKFPTGSFVKVAGEVAEVQRRVNAHTLELRFVGGEIGDHFEAEIADATEKEAVAFVEKADWYGRPPGAAIAPTDFAEDPPRSRFDTSNANPIVSRR